LAETTRPETLCFAKYNIVAHISKRKKVASGVYY
jgi:hypothetical protein